MQNQLMEGSTTSCFFVFFPFSQLKRKRVGAGFRSPSTLFQTASEFLQTSKNETLTAVPVSQEPPHNEEEQDEKPETKRSKTSPSVLSSSSSPSKRSGKSLSKKQQKLAEAAKNSHCISQYFGKKMMDDTPKNGEATVLESEETGVFEETPENCNVVLNTNNTETRYQFSTYMENSEKNTRPVENQNMDVIPMEMTAPQVEIRRTEEAKQGFEEREMLEAEGYDHVTSLILFSGVFLFLCNICDHIGAVWNVLSMFFYSAPHCHHRMKSQSDVKVQPEKVK